MLAVNPSDDGSKSESGFACNCPRRLTFLPQVLNVIFENGGMGFHREQRGRRIVLATVKWYSGQNLSLAAACSSPRIEAHSP